jgi:hypothetical protein
MGGFSWSQFNGQRITLLLLCMHACVHLRGGQANEANHYMLALLASMASPSRDPLAVCAVRSLPDNGKMAEISKRQKTESLSPRGHTTRQILSPKSRCPLIDLAGRSRTHPLLVPPKMAATSHRLAYYEHLTGRVTARARWTLSDSDTTACHHAPHTRHNAALQTSRG